MWTSRRSGAGKATLAYARGSDESSERGSALLTVLWVSAALAAVAFSLSTTVRGETERVSTDLDGLRAYYLAVGGVEKAMIETHWARWYPDRPFPRRPGSFDYQFSTGKVHVEAIPEAAKLNLNQINPIQLGRLLAALGVEPPRAQAIAAGVAARKTGQNAASALTVGPTFSASPASFQEIEELLSVPGVTPEIFYGSYIPNADARVGEDRLVRRSGLMDCLSIFGSVGAVEPNTADPAVLAAVGVPPEGIRALLDARQRGRLDAGKLGALAPYLGAGVGLVTVEGHSIYTLRATATLNLANGGTSDIRRTVAAQVKYMPRDYDTWIHVLRWYDTAWSN